MREALGISQIELDRRAGLKRGTIQDIESGRSGNPNVRTAIRIAVALRKAGAKGADVEALFSERVGA